MNLKFELDYNGTLQTLDSETGESLGYLEQELGRWSWIPMPPATKHSFSKRTLKRIARKIQHLEQGDIKL